MLRKKLFLFLSSRSSFQKEELETCGPLDVPELLAVSVSMFNVKKGVSCSTGTYRRIHSDLECVWGVYLEEKVIMK